LDVNVNGTISLLSAWRETGRGQFLYFGSDKEYGEGLNRSESDPMRPSEPYGSSKAAADLIAQTYLPNLTITRTCNIYGPGDREQSRLVPGVIQSCLKGEPPNLRNPNARREYIYVDDLCKIVAWLLENRKMGVWNIGSGRVASALEVANLILEHFPNMKLTSNPAPYLEFREQSLNTEKLCGQMDCLAFTTLQAGLRKTYEWWKNEVPCNQRISVSQATS
jgi:dTDP-glucose 4,6-dehydratase